MSDRRQGVPIAGIAGAVFFVLLIFLALQIRAGKDPAIGAGHQTASVPAQVIVRRVIVTRIVEEDAAPASGPAAPPTRTSVAASGSDAQPQAPAPAAPAPAAPAPVVTRAS